MSVSPSAFSVREVDDFQFRQMKKVRVFDKPADLPKCRSSLLALSNKFGLTFVGLNNMLKVYRTLDVLAVDGTSGNSNVVIEGLKGTVELDVQMSMHHVALSSDDRTLSVSGTTEEGLLINFYDTRAFLNKANKNKLPFACIRPEAHPGIRVQDLKWNPVQASTLALCLSDGSMWILEITDDGITAAHRLPPSASNGVTCVCWSPKGKQVAAGKTNGTVIQYSPTLEEKKVVPCPSFYGSDDDHRFKALDVLWLRTYVLAVVYAAADGSPSTAPELVVISLPKKDERTTEHYMNFKDLVFGTCTERQHHYFLSQVEDWDVVFAASAASMEVGSIALQEDKTGWELWVLDDANRAELPASDYDITLPLGVVIDRTSELEIKISEEKILPPAPVMLILSTDGVLCPFTLINLKKPEKLVSPPIAMSLEGERIPGEGPLTLAPPKNTKGNKHKTLSTSAAVSLQPICSAKLETDLPPVPTSLVPPASLLPPPIMAWSDNQPALSVEALEKQRLQLKEDCDPIVLATLEEIIHFQRELDDLKARSAKADFQVGTPEEMRTLRKESKDLQAFMLEIKETTESIHRDIGTLKTNLLEGFSGAVDAKSQIKLGKDRNYLQLLSRKPLDPRSEEQIKEIRRLYQSVVFAVEDVNDVLDLEWEKHQEIKRKQKDMVLPGRETLSATLRNNLYIINQQRSKLDQLTKELGSLHLYNATSTQRTDTQRPMTAATPAGLDDELESLKDALLNFKLDVTPPKNTTKSPVKISPAKQSQLHNFLSKGMLRVHSTAPANLNRSAFLSAKSCKDLKGVSLSQFQGIRPTQLEHEEEEKELEPTALLGRQSSGGSVFGQQQSSSADSLFGSDKSANATCPSAAGGFSGLGGKPSEDVPIKSPFGTTASSLPFGQSSPFGDRGTFFSFLGDSPAPDPLDSLAPLDSNRSFSNPITKVKSPTKKAEPVTIPAQQAAATAALRRQMSSHKPLTSAPVTEPTPMTVPQVQVEELKDNNYVNTSTQHVATATTIRAKQNTREIPMADLIKRFSSTIPTPVLAMSAPAEESAGCTSGATAGDPSPENSPAPGALLTTATTIRAKQNTQEIPMADLIKRFSSTLPTPVLAAAMSAPAEESAGCTSGATAGDPSPENSLDHGALLTTGPKNSPTPGALLTGPENSPAPGALLTTDPEKNKSALPSGALLTTGPEKNKSALPSGALLTTDPEKNKSALPSGALLTTDPEKNKSALPSGALLTDPENSPTPGALPTTATPSLEPLVLPVPPVFQARSSDKPGSNFTQPSLAATTSSSRAIWATPLMNKVSPPHNMDTVASPSTTTTPILTSSSAATIAGFGQPAVAQVTSVPGATSEFGSTGFGTSEVACFSFSQAAAVGESSSSPITGRSGSGIFGASTAQTASPVSFSTSNTPAFGQNSTGLGKGPAFGSNTITTSSTAFGSQSSTPAFGQQNTGFGQASAFGIKTTTTTSPTRTGFGQSSAFGSVFGQTPSSSGDSLFSSNSNANETGPFGFSDLVSTPKPSPDAANNNNPFGSTHQSSQTGAGATSLFGNTTKTFGFGQSTSFGEKPSGTFSTGGGSVASQGFGSSFSAPRGFGSSQTFGGSPAFGGAATFGSSPAFSNTMGSAAGRAFGDGAAAPPPSTGSFGFATPSSGVSFGSLANQSAPSPSSGGHPPAQHAPGFGSGGGFGQQQQPQPFPFQSPNVFR